MGTSPGLKQFTVIVSFALLVGGKALNPAEKKSKVFDEVLWIFSLPFLAFSDDEQQLPSRRANSKVVITFNSLLSL